MSNRNIWERVDEPVLRWVLANPPRLGDRVQWRFMTREPSPPAELVDGMSDREMHESLERLASHELIDGNCTETQALAIWTRLRISARGLIVLGEWPDLDQVASAASMRQVLLHLAREAPAEEKASLKRAAGLVARMGGDAVRDTLAELAGEATEEMLP